MTILQRLCASGGPEVVIPTFEITCAAWSESILICTGFDNIVCQTEDDRTLVFVGCGIDVALPKKDTNGSQSVTFAIDGISGEPQRLITDALDAKAQIDMTFRLYVSSDLTYPAETPYKFIVRGGQCDRMIVQITAGLFDLTDYAWPRDTYNSKFAPCLKYMT